MSTNRSHLKLPLTRFSCFNGTSNKIKSRLCDIIHADELQIDGSPTPISFTAHDLEPVSQIGHGRYGRAVRMIHRPSQCVMAVKKIRILININEELVNSADQRRIEIELQTLKNAYNCPYIVKYLGATFFDGDCWLCMESMDLSLDDLYKSYYNSFEQILSESFIGYTAYCVIKALDYLEKSANNCTIRDIKPSNILLNHNGDIKLNNFGIASCLLNSIARVMDDGAVCRPYMAPERLTSTFAVRDFRSDIWSLGITLLEISTGEFPYENFRYKSMFAQLNAIVHMPSPRMPANVYSQMLTDFVNSCLIHNIDNRPTLNDLKSTNFYEKYNQLSIDDNGSEFRHSIISIIRHAIDNYADNKSTRTNQVVN